MSRSWKQADEAPVGGDVTASSRSDDGGHLERRSPKTKMTAASAILKSDDVTEDVGHLYKVDKTVASAILKSDNVMEDFGHVYKVEKTAASAILKSEVVPEDVCYLERVEKTAATNGDDFTEASRRGVFPNLSRKMKSLRSWNKLFQSSQEGHLSQPEQFQDDPRTFPRDRCLGGDDRQTADR